MELSAGRCPHYSTDIAAAWLVVRVMDGKLFSQRRRFLQAMQDQTEQTIRGTGEVVQVAWPDVFWFVTPETICRAALAAVGA